MDKGTLTESFNIIKRIINGNDIYSKNILTNILKKYSINTNKLILESIKALIETTDLYWEPLVKTNFFHGIRRDVNPYASISNSDFINGPNSDVDEIPIYGNKENKIIRCANYNSFFIVTQRANEDFPKNIELLNSNMYENANILDFLNFDIIQESPESIDSYSQENRINPFYDFNAIKPKNTEKKEILKEDVKKVIEETFMDLFSDYINLILNEFQEEIKKHIEKHDSELGIINEELNKILNEINKKKEEYKKLGFIDEEKFNYYIDHIRCNSEFEKADRLPSKSDIEKRIADFHKILQSRFDDGEFDTEHFRFETNQEGKKGWTCDADFFYSVPISGHIKHFISVPQDFFDILKEVKHFLLNFKFEYQSNDEYPKKIYKAKDYDEKLSSSIYFHTEPSLILKPKYEDNDISIEELEEKLKRLENLVDKWIKFEAEINSSDIIERMKATAKENNRGLTSDIDTILDENITNKKYWHEYYNSCQSHNETIHSYCSIVKNIIKDILHIIHLEKINKEKAEFFKKYAEFYDKQFRGHLLFKEVQETEKNIPPLESQKNQLQQEYERMKCSYNLVESISSSQDKTVKQNKKKN